MEITRLLSSIILLGYFLSCWGTSRKVTLYTISDGLSNNAVYSITQDTKGRMWFGTIDGLHSFDGNHIRAWRDNRMESLGACIYTILEDSMQLYVGSERAPLTNSWNFSFLPTKSVSALTSTTTPIPSMTVA